MRGKQSETLIRAAWSIGIVIVIITSLLILRHTVAAPTYELPAPVDTITASPSTPADSTAQKKHRRKAKKQKKAPTPKHRHTPQSQNFLDCPVTRHDTIRQK